MILNKKLQKCLKIKTDRVLIFKNLFNNKKIKKINNSNKKFKFKENLNKQRN